MASDFAFSLGDTCVTLITKNWVLRNVIKSEMALVNNDNSNAILDFTGALDIIIYYDSSRTRFKPRG